MNLAEFPLAAISKRRLDGRKTEVFEGVGWDDKEQLPVTRRVTLSALDVSELPTASDDEVLLGCLQLTKLSGYTRKVHFSRYELLRLLHWPDDGRYYEMLARSLRRWRGLGVISERGFYDKARKSWVNRDFGIFDNLDVYEVEKRERGAAPPSSTFLWNEVMFESFQGGYLKKLDWPLYVSLKSPIAKRIYRFIDKRFYREDCVPLSLKDFAFQKIGLARNYNAAQIRRLLLPAIEELESKWSELRRCSPEKRIQKVGKGDWQIVFEKRRQSSGKSERKKTALSVSAAQDLEVALIRGGIGAARASELVEKNDHDRIRTVLALREWNLSRGKECGPGFLIDGITRQNPYGEPKAFRKWRSKRSEKQANEVTRKKQTTRQPSSPARNEEPEKAFAAFWKGLSPVEQTSFEERAVKRAPREKRELYDELSRTGGPLFEASRLSILEECHLDDRKRGASPKPAVFPRKGSTRPRSSGGSSRELLRKYDSVS